MVKCHEIRREAQQHAAVAGTFRVVLPGGAMIRDGIDIDQSRVVGVAPMGSVVHASRKAWIEDGVAR